MIRHTSILLLVLLLAVSCSSGPKLPHHSELRLDLSATVTYVGKHDRIVLDCSDMLGAFGNRATGRGEVVHIPSVRDDGRIILAWGPAYDAKQHADLNVAAEIPSDGPGVVVFVTLTDDGATYSIRQEE